MTTLEYNTLGIEFNPNRGDTYVCEPFSMCPKEILDKIKEQFVNMVELDGYSKENSLINYIPYTDKIVGYVLAKEQNIPHYTEVFERQQSIIDFLSNANGLYVDKIVLHPNLGEEGVMDVLNKLHFGFSGYDYKDRTKYIWMDYNGEIQFSPTWQTDERIYAVAPNRVAKALGIPLCGTDFTEYSMFK